MPKQKTDAPDELTRDQKLSIQTWIGERFVGLLQQPELIRDLWESCRDWHLSNGKQRVDWAATFRNWIKNEGKFHEPAWSRSRGRSKQRSEPERLGTLLKIIEGGKG